MTDNYSPFPIFIGYLDLEDWSKAVSMLAPVYAALVTEQGPTDSHGCRTDDLVIVCTQPDEHNRIHYCRLKVEELVFLGNEPFGREHAARRERAGQAGQIVFAWLQEHGFDVRQATIAGPRNLNLLDGWASFLGYDRQNQAYYRKDGREQTQPVEAPAA